MKKMLSLLLACLLVVAAFTACGSSNSSSTESSASTSAAGDSQSSEESQTSSEETSGETVPFVFVLPGDEPPEYDRGIQAVNEKLAADGVGLEVEIRYYAWDVWDQKINLMLSTGEQFDAFQVMQDRVTLTNYASRSALADLTEAMNQYGENIVGNVPELAMKNCTVGGALYGIPAFWLETAVLQEATIRKDLLEKYDLDMPTTFEELTDAYITVMENWEGDQKPYFPRLATDDRRAYFFTSDKSFSLYDELIYVSQDGTVANFYETDAFAEGCRNAKIWYEAGLISPDILTTTSDQQGNQSQLGNWFVDDGTPSATTISSMKTNVEGFEADDIVWLDLTNGAPAIRPYGTKNLNAVPAASEHPESAVKFFNWLYSSQENYDLFVYGQEGVDYTKGENHSYEAIRDPDTNLVGFSVSTWIVGNMNLSYVDGTLPTEVNEHLYTTNEDAVEGVAANLTFDASSVQTQLADVQTVISSTLIPMAWGITDYDEGIDEALDLLKKAGVDDIINEFKAQLDAIQ